MTEGSFRQRHPVILGFLILGVMFLLFWGGMTFFLARVLGHGRGELFAGQNSVGIVELKGLIISSEDTIRQLTDFRNNPAIKAIVLRIDSPGGAVGASQEIYAEVKRTSQVKPVVASMASVAASGGFYAAMGARKILANPGTLTGSIGVIVKFANLQDLFEKIGYKSEVIKSGKLKDMGSPDRELTPEERQVLQGVIDTVHHQFVADVAASRHLPEAKVAALADGRIFAGETAKQLGLIDGFGNFTDAVKLAASMGGLDTKNPHLVYPEERGFSLLNLLMGGEKAELFGRFLRNGPTLAYEWLLAR
ncbi:MAG: signal peptide peptidase SppA [Desulfobacteraceae bacterium]|nr:signal peptide peptidase SppA [Desulfobacteraceae bacterium]